jgi:hypothetical protein
VEPPTNMTGQQCVEPAGWQCRRMRQPEPIPGKFREQIEGGTLTAFIATRNDYA